LSGIRTFETLRVDADLPAIERRAVNGATPAA
jgi:hypothetical protein